MTHHIEAIQIIWTILAAIGCAFAVSNARDALIDRAWLRTMEQEGPRTIVANAVVRNSLGRAAVQGLFTLVGVASILDTLYDPPPIFGATLVYGLILAAAILTGLTIVDRRERTALLKQLGRTKGQTAA